jgi:hypothetical protein
VSDYSANAQEISFTRQISRRLSLSQSTKCYLGCEPIVAAALQEQCALRFESQHIARTPKLKQTAECPVEVRLGLAKSTELAVGDCHVVLALSGTALVPKRLQSR